MNPPNMEKFGFSDGYIDESAIDDDECSVSESLSSSSVKPSIDEVKPSVDKAKPSVDKACFQKIDPRANLTSRFSLITFMLSQSNEQVRVPGNHTSQLATLIPDAQTEHQVPAQSSLDGPSMEGHQHPGSMNKGWPDAELRCSSDVDQQRPRDFVLSPRTTRRSMVATELSESLRHQVLRVRAQIHMTRNPMLKRHTNADSFDQSFSIQHLGGYHTKGW